MPARKGQGQWALGYREPLNPNERVKKDDDGLNVRARIETIYQYRGFDAIDPQDLRGRMRWWGLYTQRKQGIGGGLTGSLEPEDIEDPYFMLRVRIDGGRLTSEQLRVIADISTEFAKPEQHEGDFLPYKRDPDTLARPWAIPGTPGLEHRIGGLEKADGTGNVSYDPDNHDLMVRLRQAKIDGIADSIPPLEVDDPSGSADVLILGWGSTYGPIAAGVRLARNAGARVAQAHLRHLNPFPKDLGEILARYDKVLVPEMNLGQLSMLLRAHYLVDAIGYNQVRGLPLKAAELAEVIGELVGAAEGIEVDLTPTAEEAIS